MLGRRTTLLLSLTFFLSIQGIAQAESGHDRVALFLSGPSCSSLRQTITTALQQQPGVLHVDHDLMPDHVLIDIVRQQLTDETLAAQVNATIGESQCRAEIMKSCITAGPSPHDPHAP